MYNDVAKNPKIWGVTKSHDVPNPTHIAWAMKVTLHTKWRFRVGLQ